jgi:dUTP pyrophosphatase
VLSIPGVPDLKVKRLHPGAVIPQYQSSGAACFDLHAVLEDGVALTVRNGDPVTFRIGLAVEVPPGWVMMIYGRSGHGFKNSTRLVNNTGVIDSDYRGELLVRLCRDYDSNTLPLIVRHGDRVAQAMLVQVHPFAMVEVEDLGSTERGTGGFGSTGA